MVAGFFPSLSSLPPWYDSWQTSANEKVTSTGRLCLLLASARVKPQAAEIFPGETEALIRFGPEIRLPGQGTRGKANKKKIIRG